MRRKRLGMLEIMAGIFIFVFLMSACAMDCESFAPVIVALVSLLGFVVCLVLGRKGGFQ